MISKLFSPKWTFIATTYPKCSPKRRCLLQSTRSSTHQTRWFAPKSSANRVCCRLSRSLLSHRSTTRWSTISATSEILFEARWGRAFLITTTSMWSARPKKTHIPSQRCSRQCHSLTRRMLSLPTVSAIRTRTQMWFPRKLISRRSNRSSLLNSTSKGLLLRRLASSLRSTLRKSRTSNTWSRPCQPPVGLVSRRNRVRHKWAVKFHRILKWIHSKHKSKKRVRFNRWELTEKSLSVLMIAWGSIISHRYRTHMEKLPMDKIAMEFKIDWAVSQNTSRFGGSIEMKEAWPSMLGRWASRWALLPSAATWPRSWTLPAAVKCY